MVPKLFFDIYIAYIASAQSKKKFCPLAILLQDKDFIFVHLLGGDP